MNGDPTPSHITLALQRPSSTPSIGSLSVSPAKRAGSSSTSATVTPTRSSSSNGNTTLPSNNPFACFSSTAAAAASVMPVRFTRAATRAAIHAARLMAHSRRQTLPGLRPQLVEGLALDDAQRRTGERPCRARHRQRRSGGVRPRPDCSGGSTIGGPSNTSRSLAPTIRSMIERSSSCPAEPTFIQPRPPTQQRACSVFRNRTASAPSLIVT